MKVVNIGSPTMVSCILLEFGKRTSKKGVCIFKLIQIREVVIQILMRAGGKDCVNYFPWDGFAFCMLDQRVRNCFSSKTDHFGINALVYSKVTEALLCFRNSRPSGS